MMDFVWAFFTLHKNKKNAGKWNLPFCKAQGEKRHNLKAKSSFFKEKAHS